MGLEIKYPLEKAVMTIDKSSANHCITLTDRYGHEVLACEIPNNLNEEESNRLHTQILEHFQPNLSEMQTSNANLKRLSWPEVVDTITERLLAKAASVGLPHERNPCAESLAPAVVPGGVSAGSGSPTPLLGPPA
jgi:hypothetical protein